MIMMIVSGSRNREWPTTSLTLRSCLGSMLFTMSMRMCSFTDSVHGEHSRKTALNSTHCSSSQAFEEVSNTFRTLALLAETSTATRTSQLTHLPTRELKASMARLAGSSVSRM